MKPFIERPQALKWRRAVFLIHLWVGVVLGLYAVVISLTGSAIVFSDQITNDVSVRDVRSDLASKAVSLDALATIARAQCSTLCRPVEISSDEATHVFTFRLTTGSTSQFAYLTPSGAVIASVAGSAPRHAVLDFLHDLHVGLLGGSVGSVVNGVCGAGLAVLAFTGIIVWWPGRSGWRRGLLVRTNAGSKRLLFDLHSAGGFWSFVFVAVISLTGVALVFFTPWLRLVAAVMPTTTAAATPATSWRPGMAVAPLSQLVLRAAELEPQLRWNLVEVADQSGGATIVRLAQPGRPLRLSRHAFIYFDPANGRVIEHWRSVDRTFGDLITWYVIEGLHYGDYGVVTQWVWTIVGLAPTLLAVTSVFLWWNRLQRRALRLDRMRRS